MEEYKKRLSLTLAETGALFFDTRLTLKDGRPTPYFVNLGKFCTGRLLLEMGSFFADMLVNNLLAHQVGPSYKGSAIASATATALFQHHGHDLLFDYDRKEAKRHGEGSSSAAYFVNNTFFDGCRVFVVDDVVTSMETKYEFVDKIVQESRSRGINVHIVGLGIAVDREQTTAIYDEKGRVVLNKRGLNPISEFTTKTGIPFFWFAGIREIVEYLYDQEIPLLSSGEKRPMDDETRNDFDRYLKTYGR